MATHTMPDKERVELIIALTQAYDSVQVLTAETPSKEWALKYLLWAIEAQGKALWLGYGKEVHP